MKKKYWVIGLMLILTVLIIPQKFVMPVDKANHKSYNNDSFWYYPWGKSVTHKGVDIFAKEGTNVLSSTYAAVIYKGKVNMGGNVVLIIGPKWRIHYYAHLKDISIGYFSLVKSGDKIGSVGTTGNAKGKAPHLHYSIVTLIPYPWKIDGERQGWKKMFYLNPIEYLQEIKH